jgi:hypothetical protein
MQTLDDRAGGPLLLPGSLPRALSAAMSGFLDEYLGGPGAAVPFAGRDDELCRLDAWLAHPALPIALVVSEAGRGKSALLARWAAAQAERARTSAEAPRVVFVPISLRFATALRGQAWKLLAHGLAAALGRALPEAQDAAALRAECVAALASVVGDSPRLIVILDGLDEAVDWACGLDLDLCAAAGGPAVKLVFSARTTPSVPAAAWRARLGIADDRCTTLALDVLDREAVGALLAALGGAALRAATLDAPALAAELIRLSEGDPLLVRLYLDALIAGPAAHQLAWMTPADLPRTPPGLDGWFARWWDQVGQTWRGDEVLATVAGAVFDVLATVLAPLPRADVEALVGRSASASPEIVAAALRALRPLLAGDRDRGPFVLGHPRLRYFRLDAMREADRARVRRHIADHGEAQLRELRAGERAPAQLSPYVLQHLSAHLALDGGDPRRLWRLICAPWQRAWEALDGTFDGFLGDVRRAYDAAERAVGSSDDALRADAVEMIARAGLVISSVASLTFRLPPNLVGHLIEEGIWSPAVAVSRVERPGGGFASETLRSLVPHLDLALARAALDVCARHPSFIGDLPGAEGLAALVVRLATLAGDAEVPAALDRFPPAVRAMVAAIAWPALPRAVWPALVTAIRDGAAQVSHCSYAASTAFAAVPLFEDRAQRDALIKPALERLWDEDFGLDNEHAALLGAAGHWTHGWELAQRETSAYPRAQAHAFIAPFLPEPMRADAYARWFDAYCEATAGGSTISLRIPAGLPSEVRDPLLRWARSRLDPAAQAKVRLALAYEDPGLRAEAIDAVRALRGADGMLARLALIPALAPADQRVLAIESFELGVAELDAHRGSELERRAQYWNRGPADIEWCYIGSYREPAALIVDPLAWMSADERSRRVRALFTRFRRIDDHAGLVTAAVAAVEHAPAETHAAWLARLLERTGPDEQDAHALAALARLADRAGDPRRAELAAAAWRGRIEAGDRRAAEALAVAAAHLPAATRADVQRDALTRWQETAGNYNWSEVLHGLRDGLAPAAVLHALAGAQRGGGFEYTLRALLPALPADVRVREATDCFTRLCGWRWWTHAACLSDLAPHTPAAGQLLRDALERPERLSPPEPSELAWVMAPLCKDGHVDRALALRAQITGDPLAAWLADLALATFGPETEPRDALIARTLARLVDTITRTPAASARSSTTRIDVALDWALDWLVPVGRSQQLVDAAAALPVHHWVTFACLLQRPGLEQRLREQLAPVRIDQLAQGDWLLRGGLAAARWSSLIPAVRAGELWAAAWQPVTGYAGLGRMAPRRTGALQALVDWLPLAIRAGDPTTPARLAELVLEIGAWFP